MGKLPDFVFEFLSWMSFSLNSGSIVDGRGVGCLGNALPG
jgi:hypothetical protein